MLSFSLLVGLVGITAVIFSFVLGIFGLFFPSVTGIASRKDIFFRYFSSMVIFSLLSILCVYWDGNYFSQIVPLSNLFSDFLMLMAVGAFFGAAVSFIGLALGLLWPSFVFRATREEVFRYWGTIFLALLTLGVFSWSGSSLLNSYPIYGSFFPERPVMPAPCGGYGCATPLKPVIYLYPTHKENVSVTLNYAGTLTDLYPSFDSGTTWSVTAYPDGHLIDEADGKQYSYLFWEGEDNHAYDLSTVFVVKGSDTASFLQAQLAAMGLTPKEYNEFIVYWLPKLQHNPYNLIHFAGTDYTNVAKLTITPTPNSILRVFMVYRPLQTPVSIPAQSFPPFERKGFTVIEWGGTEE
jgi:hypothetical protein